MADEPKLQAGKGWQPAQLAVLSVVCLAVGLLAGYWMRGSAPQTAQPSSARSAAAAPSPPSMSEAADQQHAQAVPHKAPTLEELKRTADVKAALLLEKLKSEPKNPQLLNEIGLIYENAHQFKDAANYFEKSLQYDPKNIGVRADYASCLFYTGDADGALAQLNKSLAYDPKHAGTLMNIGIIKLRGKNDVEGAVAAWEKLLQYHPDFPQKEMVQHMITQAKQTKTGEPVKEGGKDSLALRKLIPFDGCLLIVRGPYLFVNVPLDSLPLRAKHHFLDGKSCFVFRVIQPHREFVFVQAEIDDLSQWDQLIGRLPDNHIHDVIRNQRVLRAGCLVLRGRGGAECRHESAGSEKAVAHVHAHD